MLVGLHKVTNNSLHLKNQNKEHYFNIKGYLSENRAAADMQAISSLQSPSYIVEL